MAMDAATIERLIREGLPDAQVTIEDLRGDGDHYAAHVVSAAFKGKTRVQQHQMIYQALRGRMGNELHPANLGRYQGEKSALPAMEEQRLVGHDEELIEGQSGGTGRTGHVSGEAINAIGDFRDIGFHGITIPSDGYIPSVCRIHRAGPESTPMLP